ncbi:hypothetical protein [Streptomyces sp. NEAU-S77]|uniref:hypothetical protein n=1 Tax=Streptomyces sp. NEAU-S77 TaxID=3411033 RepID=UPI003BA184F9
MSYTITLKKLEAIQTEDWTSPDETRLALSRGDGPPLASGGRSMGNGDVWNLTTESVGILGPVAPLTVPLPPNLHISLYDDEGFNWFGLDDPDWLGTHVVPYEDSNGDKRIQFTCDDACYILTYSVDEVELPPVP